MARLLFFFALALAVAFVSAQKQKCGKCQLDLCPKPPKGCAAGVVKDACGCCDVCGKAEGEECDHPDVPSQTHLGTCGRNLRCQIRDDLEEGIPREAICVCTKQEALCGSDGHTYDNICQLMEAVVTGGKKIGIKTKGPCKQAPKIFTPPEHVMNHTGSHVALACEAVAFPIPTIEWTWTKSGGATDFLPSDDDHISVNMRGGPEKYQVTGWLQIQDLKKYHEGDYTCVATNDHGSAQATARVKVIEPFI